MNYEQALQMARPGFAYSETEVGEGFTRVQVVGERGGQVLIRGGECPGWKSRDYVAGIICQATPPQSLRMRLADRRAGGCVRSAQ